MTDLVNTRIVHDPFLNKDVEIKDRLTDRLRGRYACGPIMANGEPEFGYREFETSPVQHEAASALESLTAENAALKQLHFEADDKRCHWQNEAERLLQQRNEAFERAAWKARELTKRWGNPDGGAYEQGVQDHGVRIESAIRNLSKES